MEVEDAQDPQWSSTPRPSTNNSLENVMDTPIANSTINESHDKTKFSNMGSRIPERFSKNECFQSCSKGRQTSSKLTDCKDCCNNYKKQQSSGYDAVKSINNEVGHASHIPRSCPPKPSTYTIPSIINKSREVLLPDITVDDEEELFGVIKLKQNDVCYTNGVIEWVGRKRNYPINSGFKIISETCGKVGEPSQKRFKAQDNCTVKSCKLSIDKPRECDCVDMLPTVNAIVDHLNALHEAVDIVDLRLNNLEVVSQT